MLRKRSKQPITKQSKTWLDMTGISASAKDILPKKDLLGKAAKTKRFEYSSLGKKLKA